LKRSAPVPGLRARNSGHSLGFSSAGASIMNVNAQPASGLAIL
jgi:hypothetical protein